MAMVGLVWAGFSTGCATVTNVGSTIGEAAGVITPQQGESIRRVGEAAEKTFADITPEQEYFIGRAVGATIVNTYNVYDREEATRYLNVLGQAVARFSDMPETFRGYRFLILDTDEINAFAAPGGFIFISRGMIGLCRTEDDLAAVIAHEVGHVQHRHAVRAIKSSRLTSALTILALESAKNLGGSDLAQVTEAFEGSISDITSTMMKGGYARGQEREADRAAVEILRRMGYRQGSLVDVLERMGQVLQTDKRGFGSTHPPASARIAELRPLVNDVNTPVPTSARQKRFDRFTASL
ncbi:MAG TPA: M48 family metallopeptidase [Kiritimatiellia bacterium]|nr:M48 family metallopeptidase [Kiritimatiellia bacterium]